MKQVGDLILKDWFKRMNIDEDNLENLATFS